MIGKAKFVHKRDAILTFTPEQMGRDDDILFLDQYESVPSRTTGVRRYHLNVKGLAIVVQWCHLDDKLFHVDKPSAGDSSLVPYIAAVYKHSKRVLKHAKEWNEAVRCVRNDAIAWALSCD